MKKIPNITFQGDQNSKDFEFLDLAVFFKKLPKIKDHNPTQPHRISFFALLIVTQGTGNHQIDFVNYELSPGTVLKIAKGQVHAFQKEPSYSGFLIIFTEDFLLNYFSKPSINSISHLYNYHLCSPISNDKSLNEFYLEQLIAELKEARTITQKNIIASIINIYLLQLERQSGIKTLESQNPRHYDIFFQFKNLVENNYTRTRNVKDYAQMLFISSKLLNQVVKVYTVNTAKTFIDDFVILEARRSIITTTKNIKEIAFDLGFDEVTNFTKFFKKKIGTTPKVFKDKINNFSVN